jgi:hypothetical protein
VFVFIFRGAKRVERDEKVMCMSRDCNSVRF